MVALNVTFVDVVALRFEEVRVVVEATGATVTLKKPIELA